ncbi:hypothetical protein BC827DRAFT_1151699 [Russula dissimulans]|nr:hypothetical protein BC827DRAFT_1151699 [Russula dissimulans]
MQTKPQGESLSRLEGFTVPLLSSGMVLVTPPPRKKRHQFIAYCAHGFSLFQTWHQPHVCLFEASTLSWGLTNIDRIIQLSIEIITPGGNKTRMQNSIFHAWPDLLPAFDPVFYLHHCSVDRLIIYGVSSTLEYELPVAHLKVEPSLFLEARTSTKALYLSIGGPYNTNHRAVPSVKSAAVDIFHLFHSRGLRGHLHTVHNPALEQGKESPPVTHDWTVHIHAKTYEHFGADLPRRASEPLRWCLAPSLVDSVAKQRTNCHNLADIMIEGFLAVLDASATGFQADEPVVDLERLLEVTVSQTISTHGPGVVFPTHGKLVYQMSEGGYSLHRSVVCLIVP